MLYFLIVIISMIIIYAVTISLSLTIGFFSLKEALLGPILTNFYTILVLAIVSGIYRLCIPVKKINFNLKIFNVSEKQYNFLKKLKISKWKDKVPELGKMGNFPKKNILSFETSYLKTFLQETCFAEFMHLSTGIFSFAILFFVRAKALVYVLPVLMVNFVLHLLPSLIQKYVRFKLLKVYNYKLSKEKNNLQSTV